ncbi:unnamed protein product [Brachionus calyciflorus]|uniref:Uncharacterized protein n=1 Tax=Brachionus calyciflorus TaxID=104777 RepID=A0A813X1K7_9BILA|nr:unnamed protein product [Brachionus calyciflorus]
MLYPDDPGSFLESCYTTKTDGYQCNIFATTYLENMNAFIRIPQKDLIYHLEKIDLIEVLDLRTRLHFQFLKSFNIDINSVKLRNKKHNLPDIYFYTKALIDNKFSKEDMEKVYITIKSNNDESTKVKTKKRLLNNSRREGDENDDADDDEIEITSENTNMKHSLNEILNFNQDINKKINELCQFDFMALYNLVLNLQTELADVKKLVNSNCNANKNRAQNDQHIDHNKPNTSQSIEQPDIMELDTSKENQTNDDQLKSKVQWNHMVQYNSFDNNKPLNSSNNRFSNRGRGNLSRGRGGTNRSHNNSHQHRSYQSRSRSSSQSRTLPYHQKLNNTRTLHTFDSTDPNSTPIPLNNNNASKQDNGWKIAGTKRRYKKTSKSIYGTQESSLIKSSIIERKFDIYIGHIHKDITIDQMNEYLQSLNFETSDLTELTNQHNNFKSFTLKIRFSDKDKALDPGVWPSNIKIRPFFVTKRNEQTNNSTQSSNNNQTN